MNITRTFLMVVAFALAGTVARAADKPASPYVVDEAATRKSLRELCDYIAAEKTNFRTIFIGGYYMRTLVAGARILHEPRYLDAAVAYADSLLERQSPRGYWATGYGNIYLADTGSALGLFIVLHQHVSPERQKKYREAISRFVNAIEQDGLIFPSGAFGIGYRATPAGEVTGPFLQEYTISSALAGGEIFTWSALHNGQPRRIETARRALNWVIGTMRQDGVIPYVCPAVGADRAKAGTPKADTALWETYKYQVATYLGEGIISFDRHAGRDDWAAEIRKAIRPHIEFLLRSQNSDGTWAKHDSADQKRSPGVANLLIWYDRNVEHDPRIVEAVRKFNRVLTDPAAAKEFGMLDHGAVTNWTTPASKTGNFVPNDILTALSGRALADMLAPGIDSEW